MCGLFMSADDRLRDSFDLKLIEILLNYNIKQRIIAAHLLTRQMPLDNN